MAMGTLWHYRSALAVLLGNYLYSTTTTFSAVNPFFGVTVAPSLFDVVLEYRGAPLRAGQEASKAHLDRLSDQRPEHNT
jgi:hypothetical protein